MERIGFGVVACLCGVGAALQLAAARLTADRNHLLHHKLEASEADSCVSGNHSRACHEKDAEVISRKTFNTIDPSSKDNKPRKLESIRAPAFGLTVASETDGASDPIAPSDCSVSAPMAPWAASLRRRVQRAARMSSSDRATMPVVDTEK